MSQNTSIKNNEVLVSKNKPVTTYAAVALAILTKEGEVVVKGLGYAIRRVVDVVEFIKNKFGSVDVEYSSDTVEVENGKKKSLLVATIRKS